MNQLHRLLFTPLCALGALTTIGVAADDDSPQIFKWQPKLPEVQSIATSTLIANLGSNSQAHLLTEGTLQDTADVKQLLHTLRAHYHDDRISGTYILNIVKWKLPDHKETQFNNWYLYDGSSPNPPAFVDISPSEWLTRKFISGRQSLFLVYLHLPSDTATPAEHELLTNGARTYGITVTKQPPQFLKDLDTLISIIKPAFNIESRDKVPDVGYTCSFAFDSRFDASSISITSADNAKAGTPASDKSTTAAITYTDEPNSWRGLSFAVPLASYKDVNVDKTAGTIMPKTVTRQNVYACFDVFYPPLEPALVTKRYLPHPFVGLPITGRPLQHPMVGLAAGHWGVELFYSGVYDMENKDAAGAKHAVWKSTYGIKISIDAGKAALAKAAGK